MILSKDTAPFGPGIPSQGEEKNMEMNKQSIAMLSGLDAIIRKRLQPYDCQKALPETSPIGMALQGPTSPNS